MSRLLEQRPEPVWYVRAQGRIWGPYPESRLDVFAKEGRVTAATLLGENPDGPFLPASRQPALGRLFGDQEEEPGQVPTTLSKPAAQEPVTTEAGAARPLLVFAALGALDDAAFEAALAIHGPHERVGRGLWLVRARLGPAALRNVLSRRLRGEDALLVVEAGLEQAAWFNLDQAEERRLRALWAG